MRILHLGKYYPPVRGGMETVLQLLCEGLLAEGLDVTALVAGTGPLDREEELRPTGGGRTGRLVRAGRLGVVASQPLTPTLPALLRRELRRFRPDLVHLHLPNPLVAAIWWQIPAAAKPPLVVWHHADITRQRLGGRLVAPVVRACLRQALGIAVSSEQLAATSPLLALHREKVTVIPFGIEVERWSGEPDSGTAESGRRRSRRVTETGGETEVTVPPAEAPFLFVGRLVGYKGVDLLCEAAGSLPEARLEIIGDGPLRRELRALVARRGWNDRIVLLGEVDEDELRARLRRARALVLPSRDRSETFGMVQLEAMAAGRPVVATRLPTGVSGVTVDGETGRLVTPGDGAALRAALRELLEDPALGAAWGAAGRRRARTRFAVEPMVERLITWYLGILEAESRHGAPGIT